MRRLIPPLVGLLLTVAWMSVWSQDVERRLVFVNVHVFDGVHEDRLMNASVLVEGNLIRKVSTEAIDHEGATVIDGGGRTLMPGLLDAHTHLMLNDAPSVSVYEKPWAYVAAQAAAGARAMLLRGFTTVRDLGGPVAGLKDAIDEGLIEGPRVLPTGAFVTQTSGHGDLATSSFRMSPYFTGIPDRAAIMGWSYVADGVPEVQKATREVLRSGAAQIKVMAGGGVSSYFDPLDTMQYTLEELRAIVVEAEHWGTYVTAHAYTDAAVRMCIEAGLKSIEHGPFLTEKTLRMMADEGVWLSPQAYLSGMTPEALDITGTPADAKMRQVNDQSEAVFRMAKRLGVKIAWGTDLFGPLPKQALQPLEFVARKNFFSNAENLRQATSGNAELFDLSGLRHPYREGPLGVIAEGAYADILIVNGNPLDDIELMADPEANLRLIMKDGVIYKNTL